MRWINEERGASLVIVAVLLPLLLLLAGIGLDLGRAQLLAARLQTAVDAAALAGAMQIAAAEPPYRSAIERTVRETLLRNATWTEARLHGLAITLDTASGSVRASASLTLETHFLQLAGIRTVELTRSAAAAPGSRGSRLID